MNATNNDLETATIATDRESAATRIEEIRDAMQELLDEARRITEEFNPDSFEHDERYVFCAIEEHLSKGNPYNSDLADVAKGLREDEDEDEE